MSNHLSSKTNVGLITAVITAVLISIIGITGGDPDNIMADAIKQNSLDLKEHNQLLAHPVAMNEFDHINEDLKEIKKEIQVTKELVAKNHQLLCTLTQNC